MFDTVKEESDYTIGVVSTHPLELLYRHFDIIENSIVELDEDLFTSVLQRGRFSWDEQGEVEIVLDSEEDIEEGYPITQLKAKVVGTGGLGDGENRYFITEIDVGGVSLYEFQEENNGRLVLFESAVLERELVLHRHSDDEMSL